MSPGRTRYPVLLSALLTAFVAASGCGPRSGSVEGRAVSGGRGFPGATVEIFLTGERRSKDAPFASATTGADGAFRMELPPGSYWVWVKDLAATAGPRRIAEYAGNPVRLAGGDRRELGDVELREVGRAAETAAVGAGVRGRVLLEGVAAAEAVVTVYEGRRARPAGPGYLAMVRTDAEGRFQIDLQPGSYRLAVRRRGEGRSSGFLRAGDYAATPHEDPLTVPADGYVDLGDLALHAVDRERLAAEELRGFQPATGTLVEGRVVDRGGKPRARQFVFAYTDEGMIGRPQAVATTGPDGSFSLSLPGGGRYYFGARSRSGGPRQPGEWVGKLAGMPDSALEVPAGRRVRGLEIVMEEAW